MPFPEPHGRTFPTRSLEAEHSWREGRDQVGNTEPEAWVGAGSSLASAAVSPAPAAFPALLFVSLDLHPCYVCPLGDCAPTEPPPAVLFPLPLLILMIISYQCCHCNL